MTISFLCSNTTVFDHYFKKEKRVCNNQMLEKSACPQHRVISDLTPLSATIHLQVPEKQLLCHVSHAPIGFRLYYSYTHVSWLTYRNLSKTQEVLN